MNSNIFINKKLKTLDMTMIYDMNENGIKY
jgi:hypothetical protein